MAFASINGVTLHYRLVGPSDGSPLVLINSLGTDLRIWDEVVPLLPRHRVLAYDKRGHGLSDAPAGPYRLDDHVRDLLGLMDHAGFDRPHLCGISIGGMIAMRLAARHGTRVSRLVLCDTGAGIGTDAMWNERIAIVRAGGMAAIAGAVLDRWVSPGFRAARPADFAGWRNMIERCDVEGYVASCAAVRDADLTTDLAAITAPTLVLVGAHDMTTPPEMAQRLAAALPHAGLRQLANAGHVPAIEQPDLLATLIRDHLSEAEDA